MYFLAEQTYPQTPYELCRQLNRLLYSSQGGELEGPFNSFCSGELMTNLSEDEKAYYLEMEVPGVKPEELDISLLGTELSVKIQREECKDECPDGKPTKDKSEKSMDGKGKDKPRYLRRERCRESMLRTITLPLDTTPKDIEAEIKDGILNIKITKPEPTKLRKIELGKK